MRHAERQPIPAGRFGSDVPLTASGTSSAKSLGRLLSSRTLGSIVSSPVLRCKTTAEAVARGAGREAVVKTDRRLGDPGPFVADSCLAGPLFLEAEARRIVQRQLAERGALLGMRPTGDGVELLMGLTAAGLWKTGRVDIFVTHDSILAALVGSLYHLDVDRFEWPDFLDALLLWVDNGSLNYSWRGLEQASHPVRGQSK